jgi:hypothetical protein
MKKKSAMLAKLVQTQHGSDIKGAESASGSESPLRSEAQIRTDFGSGVPPSEANQEAGIHVRDEEGRVPNLEGWIVKEKSLPPANNGTFEESEDYGPKTAAMPDNTIYPSDEMRELLDMGSLPPHLHEKAWSMLRKRVNTFGFDRRPGHLDAKAHIWTKEDQQPIVVPMYSSSPEKRRVIDEQLDKWFELGVIEPSISPWSAPVVIAYRNGKLRFCID